MEGTESNIGGPTGGIPERVFRNGFDEEIDGLSGKTKLKCEVKKDQIKIEDCDNPALRFHMFVGSEGILHLNIANKYVSNKADGEPYGDKKYPDIYPSKLVKRGFEYFISQGLVINKISGYWDFMSDNSREYESYLVNLPEGKEITLEDKKNAAKATWTGRMAESLGYGTVESVDDLLKPAQITALFTKGSAQTT